MTVFRSKSTAIDLKNKSLFKKTNYYLVGWVSLLSAAK
jgi:hypothetical protein